MSDQDYMRIAIEEAKKAWEIDEVPIGALVVKDGRIIARAHNLRETGRSPLAHAEILAIGQASKHLGGWRLLDCTLYVTLEPCPMCAGACINARIPRIVFGAYDQKAGAFGTLYDLSEGKLNHKPQITGGVLEEECASLLSGYFKQKRK
nr:tRNA adenosine(34) deaminase TadA [Christensenella timonensis]